MNHWLIGKSPRFGLGYIRSNRIDSGRALLA